MQPCCKPRVTWRIKQNQLRISYSLKRLVIEWRKMLHLLFFKFQLKWISSNKSTGCTTKSNGVKLALFTRTACKAKLKRTAFLNAVEFLIGLQKYSQVFRMSSHANVYISLTWTSSNSSRRPTSGSVVWGSAAVSPKLLDIKIPLGHWELETKLGVHGPVMRLEPGGVPPT